ncbi:unnamed protein product [Rotaria sp. Silwood2]|nr:unnamed protein product [Rotaria sp. Silwood2]CAF2593303.1 unnamed protein product [Rotaria sp. Silwood2]CAF4136289.1 unnamed protein product [Rotaria sp. Silwood2]CAF4280762.1 unnamed protein product [Rotaria sp. Silwood2]
MVKQLKNDHKTTATSLLVAAHCSTIRRKADRINTEELSAMLNDLFRELYFNSVNSTAYLSSLHQIVHSLNSTSIPSLKSVHSHVFFLLVRNTIQSLLQKLYTLYQLDDQEISILRNCIILLEYLVKNVDDISIILHWIADVTFTDSLVICLYQINKISNASNSKRLIKQIGHLINMFSRVQERLPWKLHQSLFVRLLQPTIDCLTSTTYVQLFTDLKPNSTSLTELQKLFLIKCPYFLETYNGPQMEKTIEQVLQIMLPSYVSILDKHIKKIKEWHRPMMRSIRHLLTTLSLAEGCFTLHLNNESIRSLINHLLCLITEPILIKKIHNTLENQETLLIDITLVVLGVLIYEPDALDYIKKCKPARIFRALTSTSCENIVFNAYLMLAYIMDENDIKELNINLSRLTFSILNLLHNAVESYNKTDVDDNINKKNTNRKITQLAEILKNLIQYEQVKSEILNQNALRFLIECSQQFNGLSKQFFLECLWTLSFSEEILQRMRQNSEFISALKDIPKPIMSDYQENNLRHSNSFSRQCRNDTMSSSDDIVNNEIYKMADGLLWNIVTESEFREKEQKSIDETKNADDQNLKYDIMISYCYDDKDLVYEIHEFLANEGYNIWFERNNSHGKTIETQAEAIDNSTLVILCVSNSYKRDNQCQAVARYAFNCKQFILPLIVRKGYTIGGWLNVITNKYKPINFVVSNFKVASSLLIQEINRHVKQKLLDVKAVAITPIKVEQTVHSSTPIRLDQQQKPLEHVISRSITPGNDSVTVETSQKPPIHPNSRPITPGRDSTTGGAFQKPSVHPNSRPTTPGMISSGSISSFININDKINFPGEFIKRDTSDSTYRSMPINNWKRKEILDFLYDSNLHLIMPICESMTGHALIRFFRMCQRKPSRLYSQLNHELRCRFKGVTLPMGVYARFLTEIDNLLDSICETHSTSSRSSRSPLKHVQQQAYIPNRTQSQPSPIQNNLMVSTRSSVTSNQTQTSIPIVTRQAIERTIFRPPPITDQPYGFTVDSIEDPTKLLEQFERFGHQLFVLREQSTWRS